MMRRLSALALATGLVGGLFAIPAPAGAQNGDSMLDAPRLGFEIDPKAGHVGDTVAAQVNPVDVQEHCYTTVEQWQEAMGGVFDFSLNPTAFGDLETPPEVPGIWWQRVVQEHFDLGVPDNAEALMTAEFGAFWPLIHPMPPSANYAQWFGEGPTQEWWFWRVGQQSPFIDRPVELTPEQYVALKSVRSLGELASNTFGGADLVLPETFVLTFVDPVTQEMVGPMGGFDPDTGAGAIDVPGLDPGLWAVAAACVELSFTDENIVNAVHAATEVYQQYDAIPEPGENGISPVYCVDPVVALPPPDDCEVILMAAVLGAIIPELAVPRALGIEFYCILNDEGFCATPPDAVGLLAELTDEELADFADLEAGAEGAGTGSDVDAELLTEAVIAAPSFTG